MNALGPVETAVRNQFSAPVVLHTLDQCRPFMLRLIDAQGIVLELGVKRAQTRISWACLEGILSFLRGRDWIRAGGGRNIEGEPGTLDEYLKQCIKRDTAHYIAAVLADAGIIQTATGRPLLLKLA
ncbi:MAG: hypothetical protein HW416_3585 [Chloroflexi bacterium]|nr:hypothetical protein [Chloroflexota bacterium]